MAASPDGLGIVGGRKSNRPYLAAYNKRGEIVWDYYGEGAPLPGDLAVNAKGEIYTAGTFQGIAGAASFGDGDDAIVVDAIDGEDLFVAKLDSDHRFQQVLVSDEGEIERLLLRSDGVVFVGQGSLTFPGEAPIEDGPAFRNVIGELDPDSLAVRWGRPSDFGPEGAIQWIDGVSVLNGQLHVAGEFWVQGVRRGELLGILDSSGETVSTTEYGDSDLRVLDVHADAKRLVLVGEAFEANVIMPGVDGNQIAITTDQRDGLILNTNYQGELFWYAQIGGQVEILDSLVDRRGRVVVVGRYDRMNIQGTHLDREGSYNDAFFAMFDRGGQLIAVTRFGGLGDDSFRSVAELDDGSFMVVGKTSSEVVTISSPGGDTAEFILGDGFRMAVLRITRTRSCELH